jgi:3-hydroxyisobutyrate dehydrogenase-like beta-hydroxyacid dehydrogenase
MEDTMRERNAAPAAVIAREERSPVTVFGLGLMGSALAEAFLRNGHRTTVWNRSVEKADGLAARGALRAATVSEAASASNLVIVCVLDYDAAREVLGTAGDALAGRVIVNLTSGTPDQARTMAAWAAERGLDYLDGAIMTIPQGIGRPDAVILYSGSEAALAAHQPDLAHLGTSAYLGVDAGTAALYDLALLGIMWSTLGGFLHAVALVGTERVEATAFLPFASRWLAAVTGFLPHLAAQADTGVYATDVSTLALNAVGLDLLVNVSRAQGIGAGVPDALRVLFEKGVAEGHGADSLASLIEVIKRPAAV